MVSTVIAYSFISDHYSSLAAEPDIKLSSYQTVISSQTISFTCNIISKPPVDIEWIRNGSVLLASADPRITIVANSTENCNTTDIFSDVCVTYSTLTIFNTEPDDSGEYICRTSYSGDNYSSPIQLVVYSKL